MYQMGVPNHGAYKVTDHCKERFVERIDPLCDLKKVDKKIKGYLIKAQFQMLGERGTHIYVAPNTEEGDIRLILDVVNLKVVTVYFNDGCVKDMIDVKALLPEVRETIRIAAVKEFSVVIRKSATELTRLYERQHYLSDLISRTLRTSVIEAHYQELSNNQRLIRALEDKRDELLNEYTSLKLCR